jgi:DNA-binding CsgD family transcriptional regulator
VPRPHLSVLIALADPERADELAQALAEEHELTVGRASDLERSEPVDVVITDGPVLEPEIAHILLGTGAAGPGIAAVLPSGTEAALIAAAARLAAAGYRLVPPAGDPSQAGRQDQPLTQRERETLALLADGASNKLIARRLDISVHTAKFHVAAVLAKLSAANRADAVATGVRQGLLFL